MEAVDKHIDELVHDVNSRMFFLKKHPIVCPDCKSRDVQLLEVQFIPHWRCVKCLLVYRYEPIKLIKEK